ncbi:carbohydrate-binding protein [Pelagicoccus sp. SDUM812005]|uniref:carbohydrate-binding protein n=1 Tax=Pelagicoccus sp. SDUM812005 TaxID=3041257 RepID=UPI0028106E6C|nr:carbohydrate-binding protein [Pelagicoccus sp. SDUM812005]MDQ8183290.1 carbohydrate-binding protein [Pelagicoccus sp. SDUM812005]
MKIRIPLLVSLLATSLWCAQAPTQARASSQLNYTYIYFENGYPTPLSTRRPQSQANVAARNNPDLVIQTGYYNLKLECDTMQLAGYNAANGSDYLSALTEDVTTFTPATLNLFVYVNGTRYQCTSGIVQNSADQLVRLIESGQYVQRFDHLGLVFTDSQGNQLGVTGRLEVTAWADHVTFLLDFVDVPNVERTTIQLITPSGTQLLSDTLADHTSLTLEPHTDTKLEDRAAANYITAASALPSGTPLATSFDSEEDAFKIDIPNNPISYPADKDRVDEIQVTVTNPTSNAIDLPLIFDQGRGTAITGTMMMLANQDGSPLGIPVQISKNWHTSHTTLHMGSWLRGYTMIPLEAGETRTFKLRVVYGFYAGGDIAAATHSFLSVIGWSTNSSWKWDESALGAWGEAFTYDPTQHAAGAFMADVRPNFTTSRNNGEYGWTENTGGGDFLVYYDNANTFRWAKKLKTCYLWAGPLLTNVLYSGTTDDDKIKFTYQARSVGTTDYHRRFHKYKYEFLQDVINPTRLTYFSMATDYYIGPEFTTYYRGNNSGLLSSYTADPGGNEYVDTPLLFDSRWLSIDDTTTFGGDTCYANRGILSLSSKLNGASLQSHMHRYGRTWGDDRMQFELSANSVSRSYSAGDVVEGEIEFIMPAKTAADYWGDDAEFQSRLASYSNNWSAVHDEFRYNRNLSVTANQGTLLSSYPIEIASTSNTVLADFTINAGGIGHVPMVLKNVDSNISNIQVQRYLNGAWTWYDEGSITEHDYYQGYLNANGNMDYAFSLKRPNSDLSSSWRIRILGQGGPTTGGLTSQDIGAVGASGSTSLSNGTYTVAGSGADIWNTADEFRFVHDSLEGDGEIIARVLSVENTNAWAKAGIMIRESLDANSKFVSVVQRPDNQVCLQWRSATGGNAAWNASLLGGTASAKYLRLVRSGNSFAGYYSTNSATGPWTQIGSAQNISMNSSAYAGLAVTSHNDGTLCSAVFDTLSISSGSSVPTSTAQAESYTSTSGCSTQSAHAGYTGSGYVDMGGNGSYFEWNNIDGGNGGNATLTFTYATSKARSCLISVNGTPAGSVAFAATGAWTAWQSDSITVNLSSGNNTVRVTADTAAGGPNIDKLEVSGN